MITLIAQPKARSKRRKKVSEMNSSGKAEITLRFDQDHGDLTELAVKERDDLVRAKLGVIGKPGFHKRKRAILGLIECHTARISQLRLIGPEWDWLARTLTDTERDPMPSWIVKLFSSRVFDFYGTPSKSQRGVGFLNDAHTRVSIFVGDAVADEDASRALAKKYRYKCVNDAPSVISRMLPEEIRTHLHHTATRKFGLEFSPGFGVLIGKHFWLLGWSDLMAILSKSGEFAVLDQIEDELSDYLQYFMKAEDLLPVYDLIQSLSSSLNDFVERFGFLIREIGEVAELTTDAGPKDGYEIFTSIQKELQHIERELTEWGQLLSEDERRDEADSKRQQIKQLINDVRKSAGRLEVSVIRKWSSCRIAAQELTTKLTLVPTDS